MSQVQTELARLEQQFLRLHRYLQEELDRANRRLDQHEQALLELNAAQNGREDVTPRKGKRSSAKP